MSENVTPIQWIENVNKMISGPDIRSMELARKHLDAIAKPLDGLGRFEKMLVKIAGITGDPRIDLSSKKVLVLCSDNGIVEEGISQSGQEVTGAVAVSLSKGTSSVCRMAAAVGAEAVSVDMGMACDKTPEGVICTVKEDEVINTYSRRGSRNFMKEPAMTCDEVIHAIDVGRLLVREEAARGTKIIATGEMGIGNTTTSSAIASMLLHKDAGEVTGRGAGLDDEGLKHKIEVINSAIDKYKDEADFTNLTGILKEGYDKKGLDKKEIDKNKLQELMSAYAFRTLTIFGGYDIAGMVGIFLGGALYKVPVVIDGLISATAALVASYIFPGLADYMLPSHLGKEPAMKEIMDKLSLEPVICADLALGEGTGAVMLFPLLDQALSVYNGNTTFDDISVGKYTRYEHQMSDLTRELR